jgi:hypothetical protein
MLCAHLTSSAVAGRRRRAARRRTGEQVGQALADAAAAGADHGHPRPAEVVVRRGGAQELGVRGEAEALALAQARGALDRRADDVVRRPGRHGGADDDDVPGVGLGERAADVLGALAQRGEVVARAAVRRREREEHERLRLAREVERGTGVEALLDQRASRAGAMSTKVTVWPAAASPRPVADPTTPEPTMKMRDNGRTPPVDARLPARRPPMDSRSGHGAFAGVDGHREQPDGSSKLLTVEPAKGGFVALSTAVPAPDGPNGPPGGSPAARAPTR